VSYRISISFIFDIRLKRRRRDFGGEDGVFLRGLLEDLHGNVPLDRIGSALIKLTGENHAIDKAEPGAVSGAPISQERLA